MKPSSFFSLAAILAVLIGSTFYLCVGVLGMNPTRTEHTATIVLPDSAGLAVDSPVLLTGSAIGEVTDITPDRAGAKATIRYHDDFRIPTSSRLSVETLSALGEPYLEFTPTSSNGPYLRNGDVIRTSRADAPTSIAETATKASDLLRQLDPDVISSLVDTFSTALDNTDPVIGPLGRSTNLLAVTVLSRLPETAQLLDAIQTMGGDLAWLGPALHDGGPAWNSVGGTVIGGLDSEMAKLAETRPPSTYTTGDGIVPFLGHLKSTLLKFGPDMKQLAPVLQPVTASAASQLGRLDIGALTGQALDMVGADHALRIHVDVSQPARKPAGK
ncbi:MlaD family protein [Gordonia sp. CPCC 206044]|uniref:MlaD family protein n=1 Tax=Gordonia sp. CPCC 206044 TaxID=3140793 RepID=UPI003AF36BEE